MFMAPTLLLLHLLLLPLLLPSCFNRCCNGKHVTYNLDKYDSGYYSIKNIFGEGRKHFMDAIQESEKTEFDRESKDFLDNYFYKNWPHLNAYAIHIYLFVDRDNINKSHLEETCRHMFDDMIDSKFKNGFTKGHIRVEYRGLRLAISVM